MAAAPARSERRRPRPGSLERPVSARMYRGTWLLVALPLLVAAFSVAHPAPLPAPPLPAAFDRKAAETLASDLARSFPDRSPGSPQATGAVQRERRGRPARDPGTPVPFPLARGRRLGGGGRGALRRPGGPPRRRGG